MSPADTLAADRPRAASPVEHDDAASTAQRRGATGRLLRSELRLVFGRKRNLVLLAGLGLIPIIIGVVVLITQDTAIAGQGPPFLQKITSNGLFLVLTSLFSCLPLLLPLTVAIVSGDAIAGEAQAGTLRYLLVTPVPRTRMLLVKAVGGLTFAAAAVLTIAVVGLVVGGISFGFGDVTLLSGDRVSTADGLLRTLGITAYVILSLTGLVAVGLFFSTLTEVPVAAMAATIVVPVVSTVLSALPQLSAIHGGLLTFHWLDFGEFMRLDVDYSTLGQGLAVQAAWVAIFGTLAWSRFTTADVTS
jgi:ABC-2 type transport system permease protein